MTEEERIALKDELRDCIDELYFIKHDYFNPQIKRIKEILEELGDKRDDDEEDLVSQVDEWFDKIYSSWYSE